MRGDFDPDRCTPRTHAEKWEFPAPFSTADLGSEAPIAMAVGDMDFQPPRAAILALHCAIGGHLGYAKSYRDFRSAAADWQAQRFGWTVSEDWIVPIRGTVNALKAAVDAMSEPGQIVLVESPVYGRLLQDVTAGRELRTVGLRRHGSSCEPDLAAIENGLAAGARLVIICNPHNPTGMMWTRSQLVWLAEACLRHEALILADEAHRDLITSPGKSHQPIAALNSSIAARTVTVVSPGKTFNLSGLQCCYAIVPGDGLRQSLLRALHLRSSAGSNLLGELAAEAAYRHSTRWLDALLVHCFANKQAFKAALRPLAELGVSMCQSDATCFVWLDARSLGQSSQSLQRMLMNEGNIWAERGDAFGRAGDGHLRFNLACPRPLVDIAAQRIVEVLAVRGRGAASPDYISPS